VVSKEGEYSGIHSPEQIRGFYQYLTLGMNAIIHKQHFLRIIDIYV